jgi:hypothetical protein
LDFSAGLGAFFTGAAFAVFFAGCFAATVLPVVFFAPGVAVCFFAMVFVVGLSSLKLTPAVGKWEFPVKHIVINEKLPGVADPYFIFVLLRC